MYRVGIDIGGTFTDFSVLDEQGGGVFNSKVLSTPADLTQGVMQALDEFFGNGRLPEDVSFLFHATTVATNALLERDPEAVLGDVLDGYVSIQGARDDYGVVIETGSSSVDQSATAKLRQARLA